jgi:hypothetical protein
LRPAIKVERRIYVTKAITGISNDNSDNDSNKLVSRVGDQVKELRLAGDAQKITSKLEEEDLDDNNDKTDCGCLSEKFWLELMVETGDQSREKDICHQSHNYLVVSPQFLSTGYHCFALHTWDVHIGTIDVVSRRQVPAILSVLSNSLLSRPRLVPPGEKDEEELVDNVRVGDVEVVFQGGDVDIST